MSQFSGRGRSVPTRVLPTGGTAIPGERARLHHQRRRLARHLALAAGAILTLALLLVWVRLQVVHTGYQLSAARRLEHRLQQEQRELALELATLTSLRRLDRLARERLGMRPPTRGEVVGSP